MEFIPQVLFAQMPVLKHEQAVCDQQAVGKADRQNYDGNLPLTQLVDQNGSNAGAGTYRPRQRAA